MTASPLSRFLYAKVSVIKDLVNLMLHLDQEEVSFSLVISSNCTHVNIMLWKKSRLDLYPEKSVPLVMHVIMRDAPDP